MKLKQNDYSEIISFNVSDKFKALLEDDKHRVKMIQKIDDYIARVFFANKVVIVEGDTEDIILKNTIAVMPQDAQDIIKENYQIVKATGKATMISFIKYLDSMGVNLFVMHDEDANTVGAKIMNKPILDSLNGDESRRLMMHNCVEEEIGYAPPSRDKPYVAYNTTSLWEKWDDVPQKWKTNIKIIFPEVSSLL